MTNTATVAPLPAPASHSFAALRHGGYRAQFITYVLAMMADNIEHVISYWMVFRKFDSPALAGFAVVSHWLPFLMFSVAAGALADRFDPRRLIQCGMGLFILASLGWGYFFITDTLQMWHAMALLVIHGCAGVLWQTPGQMLLYDIVGPADLPSAVRLNATARYLGVLVGPAVGGAIMLALGPSRGILLNTVFYLPLVLWLVNAPYGPKFRKGGPPPRRAVKGFADILLAMREIAGQPIIIAMVLLAGCTSFFIGNAYNAQMPGFAADLGHGDPGVSYCDAAGGRCCRRAVGRHRARRPRPAARTGPHRHRAGLLMVLRARRLCDGQDLSAGAGAPLHRGLLRTRLQHHGASAGAAQRPDRNSRPGHRPLQHGKLGATRLQRRNGGAHRQRDRRPLVAGAVRDGGAGVRAGAAWVAAAGGVNARPRRPFAAVGD